MSYIDAHVVRSALRVPDRCTSGSCCCPSCRDGVQGIVPYLRYLAAAYIIYLSWKTYRAGISSEGDTQPTFASGFVVQLTNAKIILFDLSCYSAFVLPYSQRFPDLLPVTALLILAGLPLPPVGRSLFLWLLASQTEKEAAHGR